MTTYKLSLNNNIDNPETRNTILHFFTKFSSKRVLKKFLQDLLGEEELTLFIIKYTTVDISQQISENHLNLKQCIDLLNLICLMQLTDYYNYEECNKYLFPVYFGIYEGFVSQIK